MRKSTTVRMNDYDAVVMGVLEPILVLSVMAVIAFLVNSTLVARSLPSLKVMVSYESQVPTAGLTPAACRVETCTMQSRPLGFVQNPNPRTALQ
jgi:uncharacterized protein (DUF58 family)